MRGRLRHLEQVLEEKLVVEGPKIAKQEALRAAKASLDGKARQAAAQVRRQLKVTKDCPYCGAALGSDRHADHIYPVALGGQSRSDNMVYVCSACNARKRDKTLRQFIADEGLDRNCVEARLHTLGKRF